jgi:hypothetical protein
MTWVVSEFSNSLSRVSRIRQRIYPTIRTRRIYVALFGFSVFPYFHSPPIVPGLVMEPRSPLSRKNGAGPSSCNQPALGSPNTQSHVSRNSASSPGLSSTINQLSTSTTELIGAGRSPRILRAAPRPERSGKQLQCHQRKEGRPQEHVTLVDRRLFTEIGAVCYN